MGRLLPLINHSLHFLYFIQNNFNVSHRAGVAPRLIFYQEYLSPVTLSNTIIRKTN